MTEVESHDSFTQQVFVSLLIRRGMGEPFESLQAMSRNTPNRSMEDILVNLAKKVLTCLVILAQDGIKASI